MSMVRLLAAVTSEPLGAPQVVSISDASSSGNREKTAGVRITSTGSVQIYFNNVPITTENWITPQTNMSEYEVRFTLSSGVSPTTGTLSSWLALSTTREVTLQTSVTEEELESVILAEIRWTGDNVVQDTATYTLTATGPAL